jgi:hypothetical protein
VVRVALVALCLIGCGRLGFHSPADDGGPEPDPVDAPPVPVSICKVDRLRIPSVPHVADLAIAPTTDGYTAIWVDATFGGSARGVVLGASHQVLHSAALPAITDSRIGGLADAGQKLVMATATGTSETVWSIEHDLSIARSQATLPGHLMAHDSFPSDVGQKDRAFVTATGKTIETSRVAGDGTIDLAGASPYVEEAPIDELACADGPDHSYCVWEKSLGTTAPTCNLGNVTYAITGPPKIGTHRFVFFIGCPGDVRAAPGPAAADSTIIVTSDPANPSGIGALYAVMPSDLSRAITDTGTAAKVRFDGKRFWIAWLDVNTALRLTSLELNGTVIQYMLPGWTPAGPQGFQLVASGSETGLALLSPSGLDFLTICP